MRSSRMLALTLAAALVLVLVAAAAKATAQPPRTTTLIAETQVALWKCQDQLSVARTRPSVPPWSLPRSHKYRAWTLSLWQQRKQACLYQLHHGHDKIVNMLNRGLSGTPMAGTGADLEQAGRRWHVHPAFIAAIAGTESSFGAAACSNNRYNAFGLSSCGSGWTVPVFANWREAYEFMGEFLASRWPHATSPYSYAGYAACSSCWGAKTAYWMQTRFGVAPDVRYS